MHHNKDSFARLLGGAVKLASPAAEVSTYSDSGYVTLPNGQLFRFAVEEVTPEQAAAAMSELPSSSTAD
jgi:hypothetical protein